MKADKDQSIADYRNHASENGMRYLSAFSASAPQVPGRRRFFTYLDFGVTAASNGRMRANVINCIERMEQSTGWHYHECDMQFVYTLRGEVTIAYEDGSIATYRAGDAAFIPGGVIHNEIHVSGDWQGVEVAIPAAMGTVNVERPEGVPEPVAAR